jgi:hypothetical protein
MNPLAQYPVQAWVAPLFLAVIFVPAIMIARLAREGTPPAHRQGVFSAIVGFFALYFGYVAFASLNGWFDRVFLPPVVLLYCTVPLATFLFTVVINLGMYKTILGNLKLESLVKVHLFRLIGAFFVILAYQDALPKFFALIAGFGDMLTAATSILVARAIASQKPYAKRVALIWNTFGLIDILFTAITAIVLTKISIDTGAMGVDTLAQFPFCFIPAFAPPTIIFLHVSIFKKISSR